MTNLQTVLEPTVRVQARLMHVLAVLTSRYVPRDLLLKLTQVCVLQCVPNLTYTAFFINLFVYIMT